MHDRQEFIKAAVTFLQNPKLIASPLKDKLQFLKNKGLSETEVDEAINLALINRQHSHSGKWNFLLMIGICIGGYKLYEAYLERKQKQIEQECKKPSLQDILNELNSLKKLVEYMRSNHTNDLQSLKNLLVGHEKFAAPPEIPAWQLKDLEE